MKLTGLTSTGDSALLAHRNIQEGQMRRLAKAKILIFVWTSMLLGCFLGCMNQTNEKVVQPKKRIPASDVLLKFGEAAGRPYFAKEALTEK